MVPVVPVVPEECLVVCNDNVRCPVVKKNVWK